MVDNVCYEGHWFTVYIHLRRNVKISQFTGFSAINVVNMCNPAFICKLYFLQKQQHARLYTCAQFLSKNLTLFI
jgi:EamA domain-containing membrane protein RarD